MSDFVIFVVGLVVALISCMGVITSQLFVNYQKPTKIYTKKVDSCAVAEST